MGSAGIVAAAAFLAGSVNAIAGGGSFITFPALIFVGLPSIPANATSTAALLPGSLAGAYGFRRELAAFQGIPLRLLAIACVLGGATGAILLLKTPQTSFDRILPWLLLTGTVVFAFGKRASGYLRKHVQVGLRTLLVGHFLLGIYGGYFGGAVGIMTMAMWTLFGMTDVKAMNAAKNILVATMNGMAVVCFVWVGAIRWAPAVTMAVFATLGGFSGAQVGRRLDPNVLRVLITVMNVVITIVFFVRAK